MNAPENENRTQGGLINRRIVYLLNRLFVYSFMCSFALIIIINHRVFMSLTWSIIELIHPVKMMNFSKN